MSAGNAEIKKTRAQTRAELLLHAREFMTERKFGLAYQNIVLEILQSFMDERAKSQQ